MTLTDRQAEILDHAHLLVRDGGLTGLTMKKIAERVGFTEAALYRHFKGKKELILAMMEILDRDLLEPSREITRRHDLPAEERIRRILQLHFRLIRERDSLPLMLLAEASASGDPDFLEKMRQVFSGYITCLEQLVVEARPASGPDRENDADIRALAIQGAAAGAAIRHRLLADPQEAERVEKKLIPLILQGALHDSHATAGEKNHE